MVKRSRKVRQTPQISRSYARAEYLASQEQELISALIAVRKEKNLTQKEVAQRLGISPQAVSKFEAQVSSPSLSTVMDYAHAVGALAATYVATDEGQLITHGNNWVTFQEKSLEGFASMPARVGSPRILSKEGNLVKGDFSTEWNEATQLPIFKKGKKTA